MTSSSYRSLSPVISPPGCNGDIMYASAPVSAARQGAPVFIIGIMNRCGTNYLCDILRLHPAFKPPRLVVEDYALKHSDLLIKYAEQTFRRWGNGKIPLDEQTKARLVGALGGGIVSFLGEQLDTQYRILTKTPSPDN